MNKWLLAAMVLVGVSGISEARVDRVGDTYQVDYSTPPANSTDTVRYVVSVSNPLQEWAWTNVIVNDATFNRVAVQTVSLPPHTTKLPAEFDLFPGTYNIQVQVFTQRPAPYTEGGCAIAPIPVLAGRTASIQGITTYLYDSPLDGRVQCQFEFDGRAPIRR